jgi:hypothetical protein
MSKKFSCIIKKKLNKGKWKEKKNSESIKKSKKKKIVSKIKFTRISGWKNS